MEQIQKRLVMQKYWWIENDLSCLARSWFKRISCKYEGHIECSSEDEKLYFEMNSLSNGEPVKSD